MPFSVNTNNNAMAALQSLNVTQNALAATQRRITTGLSVASAADNASTFAIAQGMRGDIASLKAASQSIALGKSTVGVALDAAELISEKLVELKGKITEGQQDNVDTAKITADMDSIVDSIQSIVDAAQFNGVNLLKTGAADLDVLTGVNRTSASAVDIVEYTVANHDLTATITAITGLTLDEAGSDAVETAMGTVNTAVAALGTDSNYLDASGKFVGSLTDSLTEGVGLLVDADMAEESAKLQALQTKQQLGIQALGIANSAPSAILNLFRG